MSAGLTTLPYKKRFVQDSYNKPRTRVYGKTTGNWKTELFWGTWNVRSLHKSGAALDLVKELEKYGTKCVKSTMFQRKDIHKYTWISSNGRHKNQIDHVLINNRFKNSILNIRTLRGADMDSDHLLVGIWMKVKIKKYKKGNLTNKGQTDINKLKDKQICKEYVECFQNIIKGKQLDIERNLNVDKTWEHVKDSIKEASTKVLGKKVSKTKPWFNTICEEAVQRRKLARQE